MNFSMNYIKASGVALSFLLIAGCAKLDRPVVELQEEQVFSSIRYSFQFVTNIYADLQNPYRPVVGAFYENATDDARYGNQNSDITRLALGMMTTGYNPDNYFGNAYTSIRKCNVFLTHVNEIAETDHGSDIVFQNEKVTLLKPRLKGEVYFLRAWFYSELAKRYGGVPVVTTVLDPTGNINLPRNSYDETIAQIVKDCDSAAAYLPASYKVVSTPLMPVARPEYYGRATNWAALALKARTLLYAASPLFNPSADVNKWRKAADANRLFFDATGAAAFPLNANYGAVFTGNTYAISEIILPRVYANSNDLERENYPVGFAGVTGNGTCPTQNFVDAFEMKTTGKPISDPTSGYDATKPYLNRDPRMDAIVNYNTISFNGGNATRAVQTYMNGADGPNVPGGSATGYYLKKHLVAGLNLNSGATSQHYGVYFRSGEMLLNFAEALNEADGPVADVYTAVNRVRTRAGMPNLPAGLNKDQMRTRIQNERRVELSFEGHRYWDCRRWDIAKNVFNQPVYGMGIAYNGTAYTYAPFQLENRVFLQKMNLYPIPVYEMQANPNLTQTPGW